jgi:hypothetical protein
VSRLTREVLLDEVRARLEERLVVETPAPYGERIVVQQDEEGRTIILQPGAPHFVVSVHEATFADLDGASP